jgi:hypothetical protein
VPDQRLEERPAGGQRVRRRAGRRVRAQLTVHVEPVRLRRGGDRAGRERGLDEPGEPPLELDLPGRQQRVHLTALRHSGAWADRAGRVRGDPLVGDVQRGQVVPLDDQHLLGVVAEHPGGHQPGDAAAQDHGPPEQHLCLRWRDRRRDSGEAASG